MVISFMLQEKNELENCHLKYSPSTLNGTLLICITKEEGAQIFCFDSDSE